MDRESDRGSSEAGSGRGTPRSIDHETFRSDTPGTMPTYQYSLVWLIFWLIDNHNRLTT